MKNEKTTSLTLNASMRRSSMSCETSISGPGRVHEVLVGALSCVLVEPPALHLPEDLLHVLARERLVHEALAAAEAGEVPFAVLELRRHRVLPQRQVLRQVGLERALGAVQRTQIAAHRLRRHGGRRPPDGGGSVGGEAAAG